MSEWWPGNVKAWKQWPELFSISHCSLAFSTQIQNCNCLWVLVLLLLFILFLKYTDFHSIRFRQFSQIVEESDGWCWSSHLIWKIGGPGVTRHKKANLGSWPYLYPHSAGKPQNLGSWRRRTRKTLPQKRDLAKRWLALTYKTNLSRRSISISFQPKCLSASTEPQSFLRFPVWHEVVEKLKEDTAIGNGKPHGGHIIRKRLGSSQENVRLESLPSSPSSLVKPHNLPITRIAPGDATSYQKTQRSTPSKLSGNRSTVRIYWGSDSISHDRSKKYFDEKPGVNGYQRLVQTTLSGGSMVDIHVQHWFIFICRDRALECLHKEKRLTLVAKKLPATLNRSAAGKWV